MISANGHSGWSDVGACPKWMEMDGRIGIITWNIAIIDITPSSRVS